MNQETTKKLRQIRERMIAFQGRKKGYVETIRMGSDDKIILKVSSSIDTGRWHILPCAFIRRRARG